jgi:hypothetical protein
MASKEYHSTIHDTNHMFSVMYCEVEQFLYIRLSNPVGDKRVRHLDDEMLNIGGEM